MAQSKVNRDNYIVIQGWMLADLKLKGNELIVYACIYGFSQAENQVFNGSLQYLADWTNSTKQGVIKNLKSLEAKGYIVKNETYINGVKFCEYYATKLNEVLNKVDEGIKQSLTEGDKQSLPNNISSNNKVNTLKDIIDYLNSCLGTSYKHTTAKTVECINARLKEGFNFEDFKTVIDKKVAEWKGTDFEQYLRPSTLFGTKFEGYLNAKINNPAKKPTSTIMEDYRAMEERIQAKGLFG